MNLPYDMLRKIGAHLDTKSIAALSCTAKPLRAVFGSAPPTFGNANIREYDPYPDSIKLTRINKHIRNSLKEEFKIDDVDDIYLMKSPMHFQNTRMSMLSSYRPTDEHLPLKIMIHIEELTYMVSLLQDETTLECVETYDTYSFGYEETEPETLTMTDEDHELDIEAVIQCADRIRDKAASLWQMYVDIAEAALARMKAYVEPITSAYPDQEVYFRSDVLSCYPRQNVLKHDMPDGCKLRQSPFATVLRVGQGELVWSVFMDTRTMREPGYELNVHPDLPEEDKRLLLGLVLRIAPIKFNQFLVRARLNVDDDEEDDDVCPIIQDGDFFPADPLTELFLDMNEAPKWWEFKEGILTIYR